MKSIFYLLAIVFVTLICIITANTNTQYGSISSLTSTPRAIYQAPSIHPYKSQQELLIEEKKDPFGFNVDPLKYSYERFKFLRANPNIQDPTFQPSVVSINTHFVTEDPETHIKQVHDIKANYFSGITNLDELKNEIYEIDCSKKDTLIIKWNTLRDAKDFIPGTRFVVPEEFKCHTKQDSPLFFFLIRRHLEKVSQSTEGKSTYVMRYEVEELEMWELLETAQFEVNRILPKDTQSLKFGIFSFNYDTKEKKCLKRDLPIYQDQHVDVICTECYSFAEADIQTIIDFAWRGGLNYFKLSTVGFSKMVYDVLASGRYPFNKIVEKEIFRFPSGVKIKFSIGPVPVWIDFDFLLKVRAGLDFKTKGKLSLSGSFWDKLTLGIEYNSKKPSGQRFTFIRKNENSNLKDLIPKPDFEGTLDVKSQVAIIPEVSVRLWSVAGVRLGFVPYLNADAKINVKVPTASQCPVNQLYYDLAYGVTGFTQMLKLKIWKWQNDLGGLLPYPNPLNEFTIIPKTSIRKGCFVIGK